ncbi:amidohydrolase [Gemmatimonas sp.]|uniref:amidohydrolase n=1 Tax=Gemmatimonas sp. TaxID=1962908 RepID=UPI0022C04819|nr:amidohydrolase [Gemmatimonas sp.]MCZ8204062.1 amidohydrolase [Gemmatimonas sp.]
MLISLAPRRALLALLLAGTPCLAAAQPRAVASQSPADLIVTNARVYTADDTRPLVEAFAVRGGRIVFTGSAREAVTLTGAATQVVDAGGRTVIPGMVDGHAHFAGLAQKLRSVDLVGTRSYDEVIARVVDRAKTTPAGSWIVGRGWDQNAWGNTAFPTHEALSAAVPDHPVILDRVDGHAALANAAAMRLAGLTAATKDPSGGKILRDAKGAPTGVLIDRASGLVENKVPAPSREELRAALKDAVARMHSLGLVGMHDAGASRESIELFEDMAAKRELNLRLYVMIGDNAEALQHYFALGPRNALYDGQLWVRAVKLYADGAMGSRGAALLEPYSDDPNNSGLLLSAPAHIQEVAERGLAAGFQVNTHAIGDRGNRVVLDAYERAFAQVPRADHRFRVEHAQILHQDDIPRFAQLGVIPSMQASHQTSDMYWIGKRLGPTRLYGAYAWQSLLKTGVVIPNGSDFPVEDVNPLISFHASIARQDARDWPAGGWYPEQRMSREDALRSMTLWPAYAGFQEQVMGSITPGKYADFVVLDQDIMRIPADLVLRTRVLSTWLAGKLVYKAPQ